MDFFFQSHVEDGNVDVSQFLTGRSSGPNRAVEFQPEGELSDDACKIPGEKKRRLGPEQVKALEKSFESGNKLEPDRKLQLARALGLQPRQIAIWFQNRRARWKTKRLEKDYDALKRRFESLKNDNNALKAQNKKLHSQLLDVKERGPDASKPLNNMIKEGSNRGGRSEDDNKNDVILTPLINRGDDNLIQVQRIDYTNEPLCNIFSGAEENYNYQDFFGLGMDNIINFQ